MENTKSKVVGIIDPVGKKAGMDTYDVSLAKGLSEQMCDVSIFSNFDLIPNQQEFNVENIFSPSLRFNTVIGALRYIYSLFKACRFHAGKDGEWVVLHYFNSNGLTFLSFLLPRLFSLKTLGIIHDVESFGKDDTKIFRSIILNNLTNLICVQNSVIREKVDSLVKKNNKEKIFEGAHGSYDSVIPALGDKAEIRRELGILDKCLVVLFFGQIKQVKGLEIFLKAAIKLEGNYHFIVAGNPWRDSLDRYSKLLTQLKSKKNVTLDLQYVSNESRHSYFSASDILVLPYHEIFESGVMHMGMSYGMPIVASDLPLFSQRIKESEGGVCFRKGDSDDLCAKLGLLAKDNGKIKELGVNSKKYSDTYFSWSNIAREYVSAIQKLEK